MRRVVLRGCPLVRGVLIALGAAFLLVMPGCKSDTPQSSPPPEPRAATAAADSFDALLLAATLPEYESQGSANVAPTAPLFTAVDPLVYVESTDVIPARPFLYSVDRNGLTITRFNDNKVVGHVDWPATIWIELPDGSITEIPAPAGGWEPVGMTVSAPTELEMANRVKEIPDLTPPWTFVYVVMARSGYEWRSNPNPGLLQSPNMRDTLVPSTNPDTESSILVQVNVNDPSFSTTRDPVAPVYPHIAGAILGHGAGQPVYDRKTGNVYVGNMPSGSLPAGLTSFVSVIHRIPDTVAAEEAEIPGLSKPVIRCGPQHPEVGIPVGMPQAYACYDPSGSHPINDNEHVGAFGELADWGYGDGRLHEQFVWEFRNLPDWLTPHHDLVTGELDGILYGTPPATGEWYAEARVHNLGDEYGVFSDWTPVRLLVTPTAEYLPVRAQFAVGVPVSYQLAGAGSCVLSGAPTWIDVQAVPNGCVVMGRAPISGERYAFTMPGFKETAYPDIPIAFSGEVVGAYNFDPLPEGVAISGLAWHQVEKYADPSTETPVLTLEFIGVDPVTGWLYRILQPPGQPQPPNERPAETVIAVDTVSGMGVDLAAALATARPDIPAGSVWFGDVAVEADRDIFVAAVTDASIADGAVMKLGAGGTISTITLTGVQASSLALDSDLRTAMIGLEPGQVDNGVLWVTGTTSGNVAVVDTDLATVVQTLAASTASSLGAVSVDFGTRWAYAAGGWSSTVEIFGPVGSARPPMRPRIWSSEEITYNLNYGGTFLLMATGDPALTLTLLGELPDGLEFIDNGDGTATVTGAPTVPGEGEGFPFALTATNATGTYAQALGISVNVAPEITSANTTTFTAGSASSFTVTGTGNPTPIFFTWDETLLPPGVELVDNENGTASLVGIPETAGTYEFTLHATTSCPPDAEQAFTLIVNPAGTAMPPVFTGPNTVTWPTVGAPFAPDPFALTTAGSPTPTLSVSGTLPTGVVFLDNGDSTGTLGAGCVIPWPGMEPSCLMALFEGTQGEYPITITATNASGSVTLPFTLVLEIATSILTPPPTAPANLFFAYTWGGTTPPSQILAVGTLGDTMPYAAVTTASWLEATPVSGMLPGDLVISVDPSGLGAGTYTGTVLVTSAGTDGPFATALVTLTVSEVPVITVAERTLSFDYTVAGGTTPQTETLSLTSGGVPLTYTVSASADWLVVTPASGTTPASVDITADASHLGIGTYVGAVTIAAETGSETITVTLFKKANDKIDFSPLYKVALDVGSGPEGIAVDRKTHEVFLNTGNEAAAEAASGEAGGAETEVAGPPDPAAGFAVFHLDGSTGAAIGRVLVHSEGEYVAVNGTTGLVYQASQRTAEVAVIDGRADAVLGYIPLVVGGDAYMPYQIAVDEKQNFIYVGGHAPPIPDPIKIEGKPFPCKAIHEMPDDEYDCWNPGKVFVIDGNTNTVVGSFDAGDDPEGVVFAAFTGKVYASNEDDGSVTVAQGAIRQGNGAITPPVVLHTIIHGAPVDGWWQPECDANNYCGERGQAALWPEKSACNGIDDEAEEADKMTVDPQGNVYIIDDRYRVAKIKATTDKVVSVLGIPGYDCEEEVADDSPVSFRNTANNIAFSAVSQGVSRKKPNGTEWRLYVVSEQDTVSLIDPISMTLRETITIPGSVELDAIATDPEKNRVFITDEGIGALFIVQGKCADGVRAGCK